MSNIWAGDRDQVQSADYEFGGEEGGGLGGGGGGEGETLHGCRRLAGCTVR